MTRFLLSCLLLSRAYADQACQGDECPAQVNSLLQAHRFQEKEEKEKQETKACHVTDDQTHPDGECVAQQAWKDNFPFPSNCSTNNCPGYPGFYVESANVDCPNENGCCPCYTAAGKKKCEKHPSPDNVNKGCMWVSNSLVQEKEKEVEEEEDSKTRSNKVSDSADADAQVTTNSSNADGRQLLASRSKGNCCSCSGQSHNGEGGVQPGLSCRAVGCLPNPLYGTCMSSDPGENGKNKYWCYTDVGVCDKATASTSLSKQEWSYQACNKKGEVKDPNSC